MRTVRRILSPFVVLAAFYFGARLLLWVTTDSWATIDDLRAGNPTFDDLLMLLVSVLAWACFAWLAIGALLTFLSALPGAAGSVFGAMAEKVTPAAYRRVAKIALGITVAAGPMVAVMPAHAAPVDSPSQTAATQMLPSLDRPSGNQTMFPNAAQLPNIDRPAGSWTGQEAGQLPMPDRPTSGQNTGQNTGRTLGLPLPDRPMTQVGQTGNQQQGQQNQGQQQQGQQNQQQNRQQQRQQQAGQHVVVRGDTLWDIAAASLPDGASNADIARETQRWYDANRQVIGENPDLILPGQILQAPTANN